MKTHGRLDLGHDLAGGAFWRVSAVPYVMVRAKRLFPRAQQSRHGAVVLTDTAETSRDLEWLVSRYPLVMTDDARARLTARADEHREREEVVERILAGDHVRPEYALVPARDPYPHQLVAADLAATTGHLLLADDVGLGKTMSALLTLRAPDALPAVIVCLTHLPRQWLRELAATFPDLAGHIVTRMEPYDPASRRLNGQRPDVLVVPYSKLRGWGDYLRGEVRTVVFDEAQELRLPGSQKYQAAEMVADGATYRLGLTATPVYNYGAEIHSVVSVIAPDVLGSREEFLREWCGGANEHNGKARVADPAALGLYLREQGVMLRRTRSEVGRDLPPLIAIPHVVDTDHDLLERLTGDVVQLADVILARDTGRTERFKASGELDWRMRRATGLAKAPYVADFVRLLLESEERVVLYGWHRDVYSQWQHRLADLKPAFYTGSESPTQKDRSFKEFTEGDARVLIVSLRAGAGLDGLQNACKVCVFGELDWSPGIHVQCLDAETEILTARGYLGPDDLQDDDLVACWDERDGSVRWSPVLGRVDRPLGHAEQMVELRLPTVDLRVTSGHRIVWRRPSGGRLLPEPGSWRTDPAQHLVDRRTGWHLPVSGIQEAPGVPLTDAEIAFVGWVLTDGHVNQKARQVVITQDERSPENASIIEALEGAGLAWSSSIIERRTAWSDCSRMVNYRVPKYRSHTRPGGGWGKLEQWLDKNIAPCWEDATAEQFAVLLRAMNDGDGAKMRERDYTPATWVIGTSRSLAAERITSLAQRRGWRVSLSQIRTDAGKPHWLLHLRPGTHRHVGGSDGRPKMQLSPSRPGERVWCVTTETGTLLVRRHGKTAILGNCIGRLRRDMTSGADPEPVVAYFLVAEEGSDPVVAEVLDVKRMQSEPMLDPYLDALEAAPRTEDRIRALARSVVDRSRPR